MRLVSRQIALFASAAGRLEERLPRLVNDANNFGVGPENLESFLKADTVKVARSDHPFSASQHLFDGFNDLEKIYGLPLQVYQSMNTSEIVALFVGDEVMKRFPVIEFQRGKSYLQLRREGKVEEIVSAMVSVGYKYSAVNQMHGKGCTYHSANPGDLMKRIASLPDDVKKKLMIALLGSRAVPNREDPKKWDYFDPNLLGHQFGYHTAGSAEVYVNWFVNRMKGVYDKYHRR